MSPRPRVPPERRRQIVEALFRCMARRGYARVSISDIAQEARVARGDEILAALLEQVIAHYQAALRPLLEKPGPVHERLRAALEVLLAPTQAPRQAMVVFLNYYALAPGHRALAPPLRHFVREYRRFFALVLRQGMRQGRYPRTLDADAAATLLVAAVEGLLIQWVISPRTVEPAGAIPALLRLAEAADPGHPPPRPRRPSHAA